MFDCEDLYKATARASLQYRCFYGAESRLLDLTRGDDAGLQLETTNIPVAMSPSEIALVIIE
jgi:hypothetical protein